MANLIIHVVSLTFAVLCVILTAMGIVATAYNHQWLEWCWGVAAFYLSVWLTIQLGEKCFELLDKLGL
jgi:hypothetical protein